MEATEAMVGTEEEESPRKLLLRRGGGGKGAFDDLLGGLEAICAGSVTTSSEIDTDRPELILPIDIGLVLLEGGGAGAGFLWKLKLLSPALDSVYDSRGLLFSTKPDFAEVDW